MKLSTLKRQAAKATKFRGHKMGRWHTGITRAYRECLRCGATVCVTTSPMSNEINIGGQAVAVTCPCEED